MNEHGEFDIDKATTIRRDDKLLATRDALHDRCLRAAAASVCLDLTACGFYDPAGLTGLLRASRVRSRVAVNASRW